MISLIGWRPGECVRMGVTFHFNSFANEEMVRAESPDAVIVATGGLLHTDVLDEGNPLVVSAWDILSGDAQPGSSVLIYDNAGDYAALQAAERIAATGAKAEIIPRDRSFASEVMAMSVTPSMRISISSPAPATWERWITGLSSRAARRTSPGIRKAPSQLFRIGDAVAARNTCDL